MSPEPETGFVDLLEHDRILCQYRAESKTVVLKRLAALLRNSPCVQEPESGIIDHFVRREQLGSTVIDPDRGVAAPHVRLKGVSNPSAAMIILAKSLAFDDDGRMASIVIGLALPESLMGSRLPLLDEIRRFFGDERRCQDLLSCLSAQDLMAQIHSYAHLA